MLQQRTASLTGARGPKAKAIGTGQTVQLTDKTAYLRTDHWNVIRC